MNTKIIQKRRSHFLDDTRGANLVEYIILVGVVALFAIGAFTTFGGSVQQKIEEQAGSVGNINGTPGN